jgi:hypothetical protein
MTLNSDGDGDSAERWKLDGTVVDTVACGPAEKDATIASGGGRDPFLP